jgi:hypothetical protein
MTRPADVYSGSIRLLDIAQQLQNIAAPEK